MLVEHNHHEAVCPKQNILRYQFYAFKIPFNNHPTFIQTTLITFKPFAHFKYQLT